jgi:hypothetical protein
MSGRRKRRAKTMRVKAMKRKYRDGRVVHWNLEQSRYLRKKLAEVGIEI